tara:strand:+ start:1069 stop:1239 length:171 start_codon:yes stop_codon:yes gene_type:complete
MNNYIIKYIKSDESLDLQKIYKEMSEITGFKKQQRQQDHYDLIVSMYNEWKTGEKG